MGWRNCQASMTLIGEVNARWAARSKVSDGTIGDAAHQKAGTSDHLPNAQGVVRARDITAAGIDAAWLCEHLRTLGVAGDPRLTLGGYLIFNRRITNPDFRSWRVYQGANGHTQHAHVSFSRDPAGYDSSAGWGVWPVAAAGPPDLPTLRVGDRSDAVRRFQEFLVRTFPGYARFVPTGFYGNATQAAVAEFQRRAGVRGHPLDGSICGAATNAALAKHGYRG